MALVALIQCVFSRAVKRYCLKDRVLTAYGTATVVFVTKG